LGSDETSESRQEYMVAKLSSIELCAGAGGQALGLERAGFQHLAAFENDHWACETLRVNRDNDLVPVDERWNVREEDVLEIDGSQYFGVDLVAGGVPCPPFSVAGRQLGGEDERDLFPKALEIVRDAQPKAVMLENVRGLSQPRFDSYRNEVIRQLENELGYRVHWGLINSSDYGVPQLRPRFILIALRPEVDEYFEWPVGSVEPPSVGEKLAPLMAENGWPGAADWAQGADRIAPTLVGGSKKHGGPDVGPTRAREAWKTLGIKGSSIAEEAPGPDFPVGELPRLTVRMGSVLQGFPSDWKFQGGKTAAWRQVGNAFPPPVAEAFGKAINVAITQHRSSEGCLVDTA
jgi:DNA (cytosine-5)-methyltransferase 1